MQTNNNHIWAIDSSWLARITDALLRPCERKAAAMAAAGSSPRLVKQGGAAIIPIMGVITRAPGPYDWGDESYTETIAAQTQAALTDSTVDQIVYEIDSPGGSVLGVPKLGDQIAEAGKTKPTIAVASGMAASAAYWLGSQANKFYVTPSGLVGSVGVYTTHIDLSAAMEHRGVKVSLISSGKYKVEGNPYEPLGDEAREAIQAETDRYYESFVGAVSRGRNVSRNAVKNGFGQGRVIGADQAKAEGMVDGIKTLGQILSAMAARRARGRAVALAEREIDLGY